MAEFLKLSMDIIFGLLQGASGFLTWLVTDITFGTLTIAPWQIISFATLYVVFAVVLVRLFV